MNRLRKFSLKSFLIRAFLASIFITVTCGSFAQRAPDHQFDRPLTKGSDTIPPVVPHQDLPRVDVTDSTLGPGSDTSIVTKTTFTVKLSKDSLDAPVNYYAEDSAVVQVRTKKIILYGQTKTEYTTVTLTAPKVIIDQSTQIISAYSSQDSTGATAEPAKMTDKEQEFVSDSLHYNFKTQQGITNRTITQSGEMFIHGDIVKKVDKDVTYAQGGFFTTCNLDDPHFGFRANKMKFITKKVAITGPVHPEFEGVPIPIYIPFGLFPMSQGRHSGLLPPAFETNDQQGVGLSNLGYYKVVNDYWDVKLYGNIYSYGAWSANIRPTYRKRYHYSGVLDFGLIKTKRNFKGDPDYYNQNNYALIWSHSSDSKARPGVSFQASVNASSTAYNENVLNNPNVNFNNLIGSSITYSKSWIDKPYNLTVSASHTQNNAKRLVQMSLPNVGFTVSNIYPFQQKEFAGKKKWYEQLGIAYNGTFRNQIAFYDTAFNFRRLLDTIQWGAQHNIPITLSLPPILGGAVVISPSINYAQTWLAQEVIHKWNDATQKLDTNVRKGFNIDQSLSFGIGVSTAVFGTYNFKNSRIIAIRHVIRPTFGLSYKPDLSKKYFYSERVNVRGDSLRFSKLIGGLYSGYGEGRSGSMSFQLDNNLEMKYRSKKDSGDKAIKKLKLIDGYGFMTSYNFLKKERKLEPFNLYFRTNLFQKININATGILNPYETDSIGQDADRYVWSGGKFRIGRLSSGTVSMSSSFSSKPRDEEKQKQKEDALNNELSDPVLAADKQRLIEYMRQNPAEFVDFNIPWQITISYSLNFREQFKPDYSGFEKKVYSSANFSGSFSLTPKWNFSMNGYYDFDTKKIQTFSMSINRDMHCWQMAISVSPIGIYRFFNFTISPKSSILQDLRVNRTRSFYTGL